MINSLHFECILWTLNVSQVLYFQLEINTIQIVMPQISWKIRKHNKNISWSGFNFLLGRKVGRNAVSSLYPLIRLRIGGDLWLVPTVPYLQFPSHKHWCLESPCLPHSRVPSHHVSNTFVSPISLSPTHSYPQFPCLLHIRIPSFPVSYTVVSPVSLSPTHSYPQSPCLQHIRIPSFPVSYTFVSPVSLSPTHSYPQFPCLQHIRVPSFPVSYTFVSPVSHNSCPKSP